MTWTCRRWRSWIFGTPTYRAFSYLDDVGRYVANAATFTRALIVNGRPVTAMGIQSVATFDLLCIDTRIIVTQLTAAGFTGIDLRVASGKRALATIDKSYVVRARRPAAVR